MPLSIYKQRKPEVPMETPENKIKQQAVLNALKRTIPELTVSELEDAQAKFHQMRGRFASWCANNQMYYTLALQSTCSLQMKDIGALAAVQIDNLNLIYHPLSAELFKEEPQAAYFLFAHELRHLVQVSQMRDILELIDLTPILKVFQAKRAAATKPEAIAVWDKTIEDIENPASEKWKQFKYRMSNTVMDAALHEDLRKVLPGIQEQVDSFMRTRFAPYTNGHSFEDMAKDTVAGWTANSQEEFDTLLAETVKRYGPVKNAALQKAMDASQEMWAKVAAIEVSKYGTITVEGLEDSFRNKPTYQPSLVRDQDWVYYAFEYIKWYATEIDENNEPDEPQVGEGEGDGTGEEGQDIFQGIDTHDFGEGASEEAREKAERKLRDAIRRASEEAKYMSHQAGKSARDATMVGDPHAALNSKIKQALAALKIRFHRIFTDPKNKRYTFNRISRRFNHMPEIPGKQTTERPLPQVVFVLDTSGSMFSQSYVNQMLAMAKTLHKEGKLAAMYYCDTVLHKVDFNNAHSMDVIGGGGTELGITACEEIMKTENFARGWELVYATDECCYGLEEAKVDGRWKIHVVNVPKMLGEVA